MTSVLLGVDVTANTADAQFELGTKHRDQNNDKEYIYVLADEAITATSAVVIPEDHGVEMVDTTSTASAFGDRVGVANTALTSGYYGWVQIYGATTLNVATSCAANKAINSTATAGRLDDDATSGAEVINGIVTTGAESSNAAAAILTYPTVGATL